ncbi:HAE1 family hydrophobic/amphiphilic exporter-1 [Leucobacter luti]|uniref:HAE1 family hydrophobic/amphiphilic exporter-1 n=1 Tax=Leucobacter luti TaxID=340320 RepID=A0A4R6RS95_9MICO|nr:efflux RND transporter permease subunit [Leucobacter luti]TDP89721.1 HAE1 family hydrophobic/amphiphilic exporter-1 [Leucobacter luti]
MRALIQASLGSRALVSVVTIAVTILGALALGGLSRELLPAVHSPELAVVTTYKSGTAAVVDNDVSSVIEKSMHGVPGVASTTTTSAAGLSVVFVTFATGTEPSVALQQVQREVDSAREALPGEAESRVHSGSIEDLPVIQAAITTGGGAEPTANERARVISALTGLDGVRDASFIGGISREIGVTPRQEDLERFGLAGTDLSVAIAVAGRSQATGEMLNGDTTTPIEAGKYFESVEEIESIPLRGSHSEILRIADVADVSLADSPRRTFARVDGEQSLLLSVEKTAEANTVNVARAVENALADLEDEGTIRATTTFNQAPAIESAVESTASEGVIGLICAGLVVFVFLLSVRMTLIALLSIPLSLLTAALAMQGLGYSLNLLTLGAFTLAIGRLVDDSIVVVESIERNMRVEPNRLTAVISGAARVGVAVLTSTLTTVAVFIPLVFVGGSTGALFRPFALTASIALVSSLVVSLTIVPVLAFWFLRPAPIDAAESPGKVSAPERLRMALERVYRPVAEFSVRRARTVLALGVTAIAVTCVLVPMLPTAYLTGVGQSYVMVVQQQAPDIAPPAHQRDVERVEALLGDVEGVDSVRTTIGTSSNILKDASLGGGAGIASYALAIAPDSDVVEVLERTQEELNNIDGLGAFTSSVAQDVGFSSDIILEATALSDGDLATAIGQVTEAVASLNEVHSVSDSRSPVMPSVDVEVDRASALAEGLTEQDVTMFLESTIASHQIGSMVLDSTLTPVVLQPGQSVGKLSQLKQIQVPSLSGSVALGSIAEVRMRDAPLVLQRSGGLPAGSIFVTLSGEDVGGGSEAISEAIESLALPDGSEVIVAGVVEDQGSAFDQLMLALAASILIVYVVMVAAFRSLLQPLVLLVAIPFSLTGVVVAQLVSGAVLGVSSLIGGLMLVGIAVTNAIVLVDRFNQLRLEGHSPEISAVDGATARLRPVVMTAAATVLALVPMALGVTGHGGLVAQPLAIVVIGGMVSSTVLTLIVLPALLVTAERWRRVSQTDQPETLRERAPVRKRVPRKSATVLHRGMQLVSGVGEFEWWTTTQQGDAPLLLVHGVGDTRGGIVVPLGHRELRERLGPALPMMAALARDQRSEPLWYLAAQSIARDFWGDAATRNPDYSRDGQIDEAIAFETERIYRRIEQSTDRFVQPSFFALRSGESIWMLLSPSSPMSAGSPTTRASAFDETEERRAWIARDAFRHDAPPLVKGPRGLAIRSPYDEPVREQASGPSGSEILLQPSDVPKNVIESAENMTADKRHYMLILHFDSNETVSSFTPSLLGRDLGHNEGHASVQVSSPQKMVSRTHLKIDADSTGNLIVTDLGSANGTVAENRVLTPHTPTTLPSGVHLQLGDVGVRAEVILES